MNELVTAFQNVDMSRDPQALLRYLEIVEALAPLADVRRHTYGLLEGQAGYGIDVGCGVGRAVADLTQQGFHAVGIDRSQAMVSAANARFSHCRFIAGDATALPFQESSLNWYRAERVYLHLPEPSAGNHMWVCNADGITHLMTSNAVMPKFGGKPLRTLMSEVS